MKLTPHQKAAAKNIISVILKNKPTVIELSGRAGTGKTTVLKYILEKVIRTIELKDTIANKHQPLNIDYIAPTRVASKILNDTMGDLDTKYKHVNIHGSTVYAFLSNKNHTLIKTEGIKRESLFSNSAYSVAAQPKLNSTYNQIIIIDEVSLLSPEERRLLHMVYSSEAIIILTGDMNQANLDYLSQYDSQKFLLPEHSEELIEPIRQSVDSHIYRLSEYFRLAITSEQYDLKPGEFKNSPYLSSLRSWDELINKFVHSSGKFKYLAWTNKALKNIHQLMLDNNTDDSFPNNCTYKLVSPVQIQNSTFYKGALIKIDTLNERILLGKSEDKYVEYSIKNPEGVNVLKQILECSVLAPLTTIHSVQGITTNEVIIDTADLSKISDKSELARLYYTAISRATDKVYFTNMALLKDAIIKVKP